MDEIWPIQTDSKLLLTGLQDDSGNYANDATVVATMVDTNNNVVTNASNLAFTYVTSSLGNYVGYIPNNADLLPGRQYTLKITITKGSTKAFLEMTRTANYVTL